MSLRANHKIVRVHRCYNPETEKPPPDCQCGQWVTPRIADEQVAGGQAQWVMLPNSRGFMMPDTRQIVLVNRKPQCEAMRAETLEKRHIEAMVGIQGSLAQRYHVRRAEIYHALELAEREKRTGRLA